jgi:hypothetical protein
MNAQRLRFLDLDRRHLGLTGDIASGYSEAARVCLDRHHVSPASFLVSDIDRNKKLKADWERPRNEPRKPGPIKTTRQRRELTL